MKKNYWIVVLFLTACGILNPFWNALNRKIDDGQTTIFFHELTDYEWEIVCVIGPYSLGPNALEDRIDKVIPYDLGDFKNKIPNVDDDGRFAFAFVNNEKVIAIEDKPIFPRLWLRDKYKNNCMNKEDAAFVKNGDYFDITDPI